MTICNSMKNAVEKRIKNQESIEKMSCELCDGIKFPQTKIKRIIRELKGYDFLKENKEWLGYRVGGGLGTKKPKKAELEKNPVQPEIEPSDEKTTKYMDLIRECLKEHPQDWKDILLECIKDLEDEISQNPIGESASESETSPTQTDEKEQASSGEK